MCVAAFALQGETGSAWVPAGSVAYRGAGEDRRSGDLDRVIA